MPNAITRPIHPSVSRSLVAAILVSVALLVSVTAVGLRARTGAIATDPTMTETVAEWGD